ncbi:fatty acid desaturase [Tenuifilum thalassicum]|uniref:Fatty acid desaturase n=1 Tax=Tenuifilum thalassicum TaxID=2590900 RepID=A0A7D4BR56_9BACT|nr:fatty acid desaturase [Tenuifilum thalassicum]QKG79401.1 fatty acid desaturase [Tenuifilum thalassicum]
MQNWVDVVSKYNYPDHSKSWWQVVNSVIPYLALWGAMYHSLKISYLLTLALALLAAGFLVRIFIIFHDCGHGSFFKDDKLNRLVGIPLGLLVFTPYHRWHRDHLIHHQTVGNLDKRGFGDVETLTVDEYLNLSKWGKLKYRIYRHPLFLFGLAPILLFLIQHRIPKSYMNFKQHVYLQLSNIAIIGIIVLLMWLIGWREFILIQLPVIYFASIAGVWLFYVQHQFERVIWKRSKDWNYQEVALNGSSFLKLPKVLQWFSGNIGYHHIHHLSPRIPNYKLQKCHEENELFSNIKPLSLKEILRAFNLRLWDEQNSKLISFDELKNSETKTS